MAFKSSFATTLFLMCIHICVAMHWQTSNDAVWSLNCDFRSHDIGSARTPGHLCSSTCSRTSGCTHFAWTDYNGGTCWMKRKAGILQSEAISNSSPGSVCGILRSALSSNTQSVSHDSILHDCARENLRLVNNYRRSRGLGGLVMNSEAHSRAEKHSRTMASVKRLFHSDSSVFIDYENVAQNWMAQGEDQKRVGLKLFDQWKGSPPHNRNMLAHDLNYAGVACVAVPSGRQHIVYATQILWRTRHA